MRALRRGQELAVEDAKEAGVRAFAHGAVLGAEQRFGATGFFRGLRGQDIGQQVGRFDVAATPTQIGQGNDRGAVLPRLGVWIAELLYEEEFQRTDAGREAVRARRRPAGDLNVDYCITERPGGDGVQHALPKPVEVDAVHVNRFETAAQAREVALYHPRPAVIDS